MVETADSLSLECSYWNCKKCKYDSTECFCECHLYDLGNDVYTVEVKCGHPSYGIIIHPKGLNEVTLKHQEPEFSLRCYECDEELPFSFFTQSEWKRRFDDE